MSEQLNRRPALEERDQIAIQLKLQEEMERSKIDALIVTEASAIYYATGHNSIMQTRANTAGYTIAIVPAKGACTIICPDFEFQIAQNLADVEVLAQRTGIYIDHYSDLGIEGSHAQRPATVGATQGFVFALDLARSSKANCVIGIQRSLLTPAALSYLEANAGGATFVDCAALLARVRAIKTPWEVEVLRTGAQMCERVMNATGRELREGMTEGELMQLYAINCYKEGPGVTGLSDCHSFGTLFSPAVVPRDVRLKKNDLVRFDTGPEYLGYISDIARVFCLGRPSDEARRIYDALAAGYRHAFGMIGPGVRLADVFKETQEIVRRNGLPDYNRGHVGHSIGCYKLSEELPYISPGSDAVFEVGMVMALETPYNSPRFGGLVPEDNFVITPNGYEMFTRDPLQIVEV
ncbi:Xaa-Pro peptidase family protein [Ensifer sp. NM-2]|uniref:M24 family metallopeptidase n=1 Tax=Ensifer sp. NM-2 TaxID=2109730 RepID=UPI001304D904|nr:Xaa-Pro peptidase family protein [Ensifer sp. NM-2]